jgi:hypothetical protein
MGLLGIVTNLLRALAAYWELRVKCYNHDLREQSRARLEALIDELERLRNSGDAASALSADRVRQRIIAERSYAEHLPSASFGDRRGNANTD